MKVKISISRLPSAQQSFELEGATQRAALIELLNREMVAAALDRDGGGNLVISVFQNKKGKPE